MPSVAIAWNLPVAGCGPDRGKAFPLVIFSLRLCKEKWLGRRSRTKRSALDKTPRQNGNAMAKYLISFPAAAMIVPDGEWNAVVHDAHAVIEDAKAAGVYVFAGGIDDSVPPMLVAADGSTAEGRHPLRPALDGGFAVLELASREVALDWAARFAKACRCAQELRVFGFDPAS
jgi:hypothetical protein